jgi:hypothetical protein
MTVGDFYKRNAPIGADFEVVLHHGEDEERCKARLRAVGITVRDDAAMGNFTIHLDDPLDWAKVGEVVCGEIHGESDIPTGDGAREAHPVSAL